MFKNRFKFYSNFLFENGDIREPGYTRTELFENQAFENCGSSMCSNFKNRRIKTVTPKLFVYDFLYIFNNFLLPWKNCLHIYFCSNFKNFNTNTIIFFFRPICHSAFTLSIKFHCCIFKNMLNMFSGIVSILRNAFRRLCKIAPMLLE